MIADTNPKELFDAFRSIAMAGGGTTSGLTLTFARMLAAVRLWPTGRDGLPGFLDENREITKADWLAMIQMLAKRWKAAPGLSDNPFEQPAEEPPVTPGALEHLRRLILGYLTGRAAGASAPGWLLKITLDLSHERNMSLERLDQNLCDLIVESIGATVKTRVFCAYEGATGIALDLAIGGADVSLDIHQERLSALCTCLALAGDLRLRVRQGDPFQLARADMSAASQLHDAYDVSVVVPPINKRHEPHDDDALGTGLPTPANSEAIGVTLALARASKLAMCLLPPNFLFRSSTTDKIFREHVIRKFGIDTIVGLPSGMFSGSMISSALLFFKPSAARGARSRNLPSVFMIDAREGWKRSAPDAGKLEALADLLRTHKPTDISVSVSIDDLAANNFDLSVGRYVLDPLAQRVRKVAADETLVSLEDLVELYRPQAIPSAKGTASAPELTLAEVGVADIDEAGLVRYPSKQLAMAQDVALQARRAHLESGDVLLVIKGSVGKIGFVRAIPEGTPWLASQSFAILRLRQHAPLKDPRILFRFLSSGLGQSYIRSICVGTAVPTLQMATVRRLMIVLPSPAEQESIAREVEGLFELQDQIQKLRADLAVTQGQIWPETPKTTPLAALSETGESRQESTPHRKSAS